jgi:hypothetical protein
MMQRIDALVRSLLGPLDGYKTKLGAWLMMALAANQAVPFLPEWVATLTQLLALSLMGYGLRDALERFQKP